MPDRTFKIIPRAKELIKNKNKINGTTNNSVGVGLEELKKIIKNNRRSR